MGKCGAPGRRARFEGISGLAALALEMPQDSINHACISNNGDNLHLSATGTQHGIYFKNLGKQARPCAASIFGELRVLVGPGGLCCGTGEILRHSGGYSRAVAIGSIRASGMLAGIGNMRADAVNPLQRIQNDRRFARTRVGRCLQQEGAIASVHNCPILAADRKNESHLPKWVFPSQLLIRVIC